MDCEDPNAADTLDEGRGSEKLPFKTIQAAVDQAGAGETVWVKPGTYATGGRTEGDSSVTLSRVVMGEGVILAATEEDPARTIIRGEEGCRCVFVKKGCIIRGFTLDGGKTVTTATGDANQYGGGIWGTGANVVNCIIQDCKAARGGGNYGSSAFYRCQFLRNVKTVLASASVNGSFYNCLFYGTQSGTYSIYNTDKLVNCTFTGTTGMSDHNSNRRAINCLILQSFNTINGTYENCCFGYSGVKPDETRCDDRCRFADSPSAFPLLADYAPSRRSPCYNACTDYEAYVAEFPEAFRSEAALDVYGRPRIGAGETAFDIGCVERDPTIDVEDWYVDPVKGDDTYVGDDIGLADHPYKTLQAAMENVRLDVGHTVWAAPGVYREGGSFDAENTLSNRVVVKAGVRLESLEGAAVTVIEGAPAPGQKPGTAAGVAANAMRCARLETDAVLRGFTLTNGHGGERDADGCYGGGSSGGTLCDCVISNCYAIRGAAVQKSALNRCFVTGCGCCGPDGPSKIGIVNNSSAIYNCVFGPQITGSYVTLVCNKIRNCTFLPCGLSAVHYINNMDVTHVCNSVILGVTKDEPHYSNCAFATNGNVTAISDANLGVGSFRCDASDCKIGADGSIGAGSILIDRGDKDLYPGVADEWDCLANKRVRNGTIDIGCAEYDANPPQLTISDSSGGLSIEGAKVGDNRIRFGEPIAFSIGIGSASSRIVRGFTVNGEYHSFADHEKGWRYERTISDETERVVVEAVCHDEWYVDPTGGDDANDGMTRETAFKTFHAAFTNAYMATGDTVWALPGVYDSEIFTNTAATAMADQLTLNRLIVPAGIKVVSTDGPAVTVIRGAMASPENRCGKYVAFGLGTNSVRSVILRSNAELRGFTVADGTAYSDGIGSSKYATGGNISAAADAYIVDCVVTNGAAERGGGATGGNYIRCRFTGNACGSIGATFVGTVNLFGCIVEKSRNYYAWFNSDGASKVVNSIFTADNSTASFRDREKKLHFYNSIDLKGRGSQEGGIYHHSITVKAGGLDLDTDTIVTNAADVALDANLAPVKGSLALDIGCAEDFLTNWPSAYMNEATRDLLGTPRVLGSAIDVGAAEYDWRRDFAADLGRKVVVADATPGVVESGTKSVLVSDGGEVVVGWADLEKAPKDRVFRFNVMDGTLTVKVNGEAVATFTEGGEWKYADGEATDAVVFSFAASEEGGSAELLRSASDTGVLLIVR